VAFYSDKHAIFRVNSKEAQGGDGMTQFGRALDELTIEIICANAPQSTDIPQIHSLLAHFRGWNSPGDHLRAASRGPFPA